MSRQHSHRHPPEQPRKQAREQALLVGLREPRESTVHFEATMDEVRRLADTARLRTVETITQPLRTARASTLVGSGKVIEIKERIQMGGVDVVIVARDLSPLHQRNLELALERRVIDRTELILDIFAQHAVSRDGKIQVELAQLRYLKPRLIGRGVELSRLGGGIGTRGPGETQLEVDRRRLDRRIHQLTKEWEKCRAVGKNQRRRRQSRGVINAALVGYTNAGKSTLLNRLTKSDVQAEDQLFCTLDTTTRRLFLSGGPRLLLSDTVGFIEELPAPLLAAFRATLAVVEEADILIHVMDVSAPDVERPLVAVMDILRDLEVADRPILTILNKRDRVENDLTIRRLQRLCPPAVPFSATKDTDTAPLLEAITDLAAQSGKWERESAPHVVEPWEAELLEESERTP